MSYFDKGSFDSSSDKDQALNRVYVAAGQYLRLGGTLEKLVAMVRHASEIHDDGIRWEVCQRAKKEAR